MLPQTEIVGVSREIDRLRTQPRPGFFGLHDSIFKIVNVSAHMIVILKQRQQ